MRIPEVTNCPFCEIVAGSRPGAIVFQDQTILSFVNPRQYENGSILIITKRHKETFLGLTKEEIFTIITHAQIISHALCTTYGASGINIYQNNGISAGQTIPHYHLHVVPRYGDESSNHLIEDSNMEVMPIEKRLIIAESLKRNL